MFGIMGSIQEHNIAIVCVTHFAVESTFRTAIADGRVCPVDGEVVLHCLLVWISDGTARGYAGEGVLR